MEVDLGQLDLAPQILLGEVGPVIRPVGVAAENHDLTLEAVLPEAEGRGVASPSSTHDHYTSRSHEYPPRIAVPTARLPEPLSQSTALTFLPVGNSAHLEIAAAAGVGALWQHISIRTHRGQSALEQ